MGKGIGNVLDIVNESLPHQIQPHTQEVINKIKPVLQVAPPGGAEEGVGNAPFHALNDMFHLPKIHAEIKIPYQKQRIIDQVTAQLLEPEDITEKPGFGHKALMNKLHQVTAHLTDNQRKQLVSKELHKLHDIVAAELKKIDITSYASNLNQDEFELAVESMLNAGYSEDEIMSEAERKFGN